MKAIAFACVAVLAAACGKSNTPIAKSGIDKVRWAGSVVVEGGQDLGGTEGKKPKFRTYICLEKTNGEEREAAATVDLNQLGLELVHKNESMAAGTLTRKLEKLDFRVRYSTKVIKEQSRAHAKIGATIMSKQKWSVVAHTGDFDPEKANEAFSRDPEFHSISFGLPGSFESVTYKGADGRPDAYIKVTYERAGHLGEDKTKLVTTHCEGQNEPVVIEQL